MSFITLSMCPYRLEGDLQFPPPVPLEVGSANQILFGANGYDPDFPGFPTDVFGVWHRNWKPRSWDLTGTASGRGHVVGYTAFPGAVTLDNPVVQQDGSVAQLDFTQSVEWELTGQAPTSIQPDFSRPENVRNMIQFVPGGADQKVVYYPEAFPVFWDEDADNQTGWYIETRFIFLAEITPYYWRQAGQYILNHEFICGFTTRAVPSPEQEPPAGWTQAEFSSLEGPLGQGSSRGTDPEVFGSVRIVDDTGADPHGSWGSVPMYKELSTGATMDLQLHVVSNFLPRNNP